ncbi:SafA/ExsA family spore coat assembly protein [Bacillus spongiae]|uniref:SafA/ExsA family spore coat assembly protein n=1 Tax=Bacillus spongiae TaxID=2683610 RepID=A0ABU8H8Q4_9BACI
MKIHIVQKGDTLWKIAKKYGVDFEEVKKMNAQLSNPDMIMPGMKIKVPTSGGTVKKQVNFGAKEMPKATHPYKKEMPYKEAPKPMKKEVPVQPPPKMPTPVIPEIDINNYYMMNMANMQIKKEAPVLPEKPPNVLPVVEKEKPVVEESPECPPMPMYEQCVPVSPIMPGAGFCPPQGGYAPHMPYSSYSTPMHHQQWGPNGVAGVDNINAIASNDESSPYMGMYPGMMPENGVPYQIPGVQNEMPAQMGMAPGSWGMPMEQSNGMGPHTMGMPMDQSNGMTHGSWGMPMEQNNGMGPHTMGMPMEQNNGMGPHTMGMPMEQNNGMGSHTMGMPMEQNNGMGSHTMGMPMEQGNGMPSHSMHHSNGPMGNPHVMPQGAGYGPHGMHYGVLPGVEGQGAPFPYGGTGMPWQPGGVVEDPGALVPFGGAGDNGAQVPPSAVAGVQSHHGIDDGCGCGPRMTGYVPKGPVGGQMYPAPYMGPQYFTGPPNGFPQGPFSMPRPYDDEFDR